MVRKCFFSKSIWKTEIKNSDTAGFNGENWGKLRIPLSGRGFKLCAGTWTWDLLHKATETQIAFSTVSSLLLFLWNVKEFETDFTSACSGPHHLRALIPFTRELSTKMNFQCIFLLRYLSPWIVVFHGYMVRQIWHSLVIVFVARLMSFWTEILWSHIPQTTL